MPNTAVATKTDYVTVFYQPEKVSGMARYLDAETKTTGFLIMEIPEPSSADIANNLIDDLGVDTPPDGDTSDLALLVRLEADKAIRAKRSPTTFRNSRLFQGLNFDIPRDDWETHWLPRQTRNIESGALSVIDQKNESTLIPLMSVSAHGISLGLSMSRATPHSLIAGKKS